MNWDEKEKLYYERAKFQADRTKEAKLERLCNELEEIKSALLKLMPEKKTHTYKVNGNEVI